MEHVGREILYGRNGTEGVWGETEKEVNQGLRLGATE